MGSFLVSLFLGRRSLGGNCAFEDMTDFDPLSFGTVSASEVGNLLV